MEKVALSLGNSYSSIQGLTSDHHKRLSGIMSYVVDTGGYGGFQRRQKLLSKTGEFGTGLLYLVSDYLTKHQIPFKITDPRIAPISQFKLFNLKLPHNPYPEQIASVEAARRLKRGIISAVTGSGKSLMMALLINRLQLKVLIVVPTLELKKQLREDFTQWFGSLDNITIENIASPKLEVKGDYNLLLIDEAHHAASKTYRTLNKKVWNSIYYKFFYTATAYRSNSEEQLLMESVTGQVIFSLDYKTAVAKGYVCPIDAYYFIIPTKTEVEGFTWAQVYRELVTENRSRNLIITDLLESLDHAGESTLCLVKEVQHGRDLVAKCDFAQFVCGVDDESKVHIKDFNKGKIKSLIGTTGVLSEGIDTKACSYVVIAGLGKSKNAFVQMCGRAIRKYPGKESAKVIIFLDKSHKFTKSHFAAQKKILRDEFGVVPVLLTLE